jgi:hypothetical protein
MINSYKDNNDNSDIINNDLLKIVSINEKIDINDNKTNNETINNIIQTFNNDETK